MRKKLKRGKSAKCDFLHHNATLMRFIVLKNLITNNKIFKISFLILVYFYNIRKN